MDVHVHCITCAWESLFLPFCRSSGFVASVRVCTCGCMYACMDVFYVSSCDVCVLGVPVPSRHLNGVDSLYSIVQMPKGVPVATFAIGTAGAANAALFAVAMLAADRPALAQQLAVYRTKQSDVARAMTKDLVKGPQA